MKEARPNIYSTADLDRLGLMRGDEAFYKKYLGDPTSYVLVYWRGKHLITETAQGPRATRIPITQLQFAELRQDALTLLGHQNDTVFFAIDFSTYDVPPYTDHGEYQDLRTIGLFLPQDEASMLVYARGLLNWHRSHRFCGACGTTTESRAAGHQRQCSNPTCGILHFPRTDPAVIMLVTDGDHLVLARQSSWPKGQYSVLAGFVEPGESLEDAVRRETFEEVGLKVDHVLYQHSQPWPFPASLMIGFIAEVASRSPLKTDPREIETAKWCHWRELLDVSENDSFRFPRRDSISWRLIDDWLAAKQK